MRFTKITLAVSFLALGVFSKESQTYTKIDSLNWEIERLEKEIAGQLNRLEDKEALRWQARYNHSQKMKEFEEISRKLESNYSQLSNALNQTQEALNKETNITEEKKANFEEEQKKQEAFRIRVLQGIEKEAEDLAKDFPLEISSRTKILSELQSTAEDTTRTQLALRGYFEYKLNRYLLTQTSAISKVNTIFGNSSQPGIQLQLGTVFLSQASQENNLSQILLRTGSLTGQIYTWRSDLASNYNDVLVQGIKDAQLKKPTLLLPFDVLQNKSSSSGYVRGEETTVFKQFKSWFIKGGVVMYPLMFVALLALLFCIDRYILLTRRSINPIKLKKKLEQVLQSKNYSEAAKICTNSKSTLGSALSSIYRSVGKPRDVAQKALQETLMKEVPQLEKRMMMISALGSAAPLLGLLGTVSGMISLFKVITDVGTNDPRILAGGISEALITTEAGLLIAIPILLVLGYLNDRLDKVQNEVAAESAELINQLWPGSTSGGEGK